MRWQGRRESDNVEDRRGLSRGTAVAGGGIGTLLFVVVALYMGADPMVILNQVAQQNQGQVAAPPDPAQDKVKDFVSVVLADTEDVWTKQFEKMGKQYRKPKLVLFNGVVESACGQADSAVGPFYCPGDEKLYIDLTFFDELDRKFKAPGDFAQAYVIAHEVGHHIQKQLGITDKVHGMRQRLSEAEYNRLSVRLELQADFLAGVWAHHADKSQQILEPGDLEEALAAASAVGDDRLQKQSRGTVTPDSFTHGSSAQRARWFRKGFTTGDINQGDTFAASEL